MIKIYKILTFVSFILTGCLVTPECQGREVTLKIKSLGSGLPVRNAVVDLQSCHIGKFLTDANGMVQIDVHKTTSCVLYISSSGFITLVRPFEIAAGFEDIELVFYMQKQEQYKTGRILSATSYAPIPGVQVFKVAQDSSEMLIGVSDQDGTFGVVNYKPGEYHLIFRHPGYLTHQKSVFIRQSDGHLGAFYMENIKPVSVTMEEESPKLSGIASQKFTFIDTDQKYIILLGLYQDRDHLPEASSDLEIRFAENGGLIRMFLGPFPNEKMALVRLDEIKELYPEAKLERE